MGFAFHDRLRFINTSQRDNCFMSFRIAVRAKSHALYLLLSSQYVCRVTTGSTPQTVRDQTSGLQPQEAPVMIAEKRKLFSSFPRDTTK